MSHFESCLKRRFFVIKKVLEVIQIRGRGWGGGNLDKIQKNSSFFSGNRPLLKNHTSFYVLGSSFFLAPQALE